MATEIAAAPKRHYPAILLGVLGGLLVPAVKWLVTKDLGMGDFLIAAVPIVMGAITHTQVTPVKDIAVATAEKVGEATVLVAKKMDATAAGAIGTTTATGEKIAADVTAQVAGTTPSLADSIIRRTKAKVGL